CEEPELCGSVDVLAVVVIQLVSALEEEEAGEDNRQNDKDDDDGVEHPRYSNKVAAHFEIASKDSAKNFHESRIYSWARKRFREILCVLGAQNFAECEMHRMTHFMPVCVKF